MGYVVYMHRCKENGKIYIGKTNDIKRRWRSNGIEYKPGKGEENNRPFWNAIKKYGWSCFEHIILEKGLTDEEASEKEKYYIRLYDARNKAKGYNVAKGGNGGLIYKEHPKGMKGKHHSEEKKVQQRELMKRLNAEGKCGANWKNGHPKGMSGKHHSEEFKAKLRAIKPEKHPSARKTVVEYLDGTKEQYGCLKYCSESLKVSESTLITIIKSNKPYKISRNCRSNLENLKRIEGARIYYI